MLNEQTEVDWHRPQASMFPIVRYELLVTCRYQATDKHGKLLHEVNCSNDKMSLLPVNASNEWESISAHLKGEGYFQKFGIRGNLSSLKELAVAVRAVSWTGKEETEE